eukprot:TRINITY_DN54909_c0_g1_i3.p1 TRINITY_DN54909_c0_g1~~TRINITY_DN54909_c0_g1_i3.p1  ORF type:complete len:207 (+),score=64.67 TRINITY_DN54909_c0_g1_i3:141-761(+)
MCIRDRSRLTAKEKAKAAKGNTRDSVKGIIKTVKDATKTKIRRSKGLHAAQRIERGMNVRKKSYKKEIGKLPRKRGDLEKQGHLTSAELCLSDSVEMLMDTDNDKRKVAEEAYAVARKNDPKGLREQLAVLVRKTKVVTVRTMANLLIKDIEKAYAVEDLDQVEEEEKDAMEEEQEGKTAKTSDPDDLSLAKHVKNVRRLVANLNK